MKRFLLSLIAFAGVWMTAGAVDWVTESEPTTTDKRYVLEVNSGYFLMDNKSDSKNTLKSCNSATDVPTLWNVFEESLYSEARKQYLFRNMFTLSTNASKSESHTKAIKFEDNQNGTYKMFHDRLQSYYFYGERNNTALQCDGLTSAEKNKDKSKFKFISETQWTNHWSVDAYEKAVDAYNAKKVEQGISAASIAWAENYLDVDNADNYQSRITNAGLNTEVDEVTALITAWNDNPEKFAYFNETEQYNGYNFNKQGMADVVVKHTFWGGEWNTICLPFKISAADLHDVIAAKGVDVSDVAELKSFSDNTLHFSTVSTLAAGQPYLIWVNTISGASSQEVEIQKQGVSLAAVGSVTIDGATFKGTYDYIANLNDGKNDIYVINGNAFYCVNSTVSTKGFRGYFIIPEGGAKIVAASFADDETGITSVNENVYENENLYNIAGQRVGENAKGIIIKNGKKYLVK